MSFKELLKLIWQYLRPQKRMVYFCIFLATLAAVISAIIPIIYGRLVDTAVNPNPDLKMIALTLFVWFVFVLIANWISRFNDFKGSQLGNEVFQSFTTDIYYHYLQLPLSFHKDKKSGEQMNKVSRAANFIWDITESLTFYLLPSFLTALVAIILMFMTEWRLTLVIILILFFYTLISVIKNRPILEAEKKSNKLWELAWGHIYDSVHNIQLVKAHIKENEERLNAENFLNRVRHKMTDFFWGHRRLSAWRNNIQGLGFIIVFALALYFLIQKQITAGVLVSFVGYVNLVFRPFNQLTDHYRQLQRGMITIGRAVKLFDIEKELYGHGKKLKNIKGRIEFKKVSFAYDDKYKKVLKNINFRAEPGETIALVGESGAGKTTLVGLLSRNYELKSGQILLDGHNINELELTSLREKIAIVPQEISLFNNTIKKNLVYAKKRAGEKEIIEALKAANAWDFVSKFPKKINQKVGERGIKLSTGQKQRIAIARAILRDPKILILDEATSSLDSISEKLVQEALKNLILSRTTFIIAHRLSTILQADKILVFDKGELVEQGRHDELIKNQGVYWRLYQKQKF